MSKLPPRKNHVAGKWDLVVGVRTPDGGTIEFSTTKSLDPDDPMVKAVRRALAVCLGVSGKEPKP